MRHHQRRDNTFIIENKRKKKSQDENKEGEPKKKAVFDDLVRGTPDIPFWAVLPNATKLNDNR